MFTLKMDVEVMEHNIRNGAIQWQISKFIKDNKHFALDVTISEILTLNFDLKNLGQGRRVQHSQ